MKQLLTVMAILLFAGLTQGFTVPSNTENNLASSYGTRANNAKWQHTTCVNPWIGVKKAITPAKLFTTVPVYCDITLASNTPYCRVYVDGVLQVDVTSSANLVLNVPVGSTVYYEVSVNPLFQYLMTYVDENCTAEQPPCGGRIFLQDEGFTASFSWTVLDVSNYILFIRD